MLFWKHFEALDRIRPAGRPHRPRRMIEKSAWLALGMSLMPWAAVGAPMMDSMEGFTPMAATAAAQGQTMVRNDKSEAEMGERFGRFMNSFMNTMEQPQEDAGENVRKNRRSRTPERYDEMDEERARTRRAPQGAYATPYYDPWGGYRWGNPLYEDPWMHGGWGGPDGWNGGGWNGGGRYWGYPGGYPGGYGQGYDDPLNGYEDYPGGWGYAPPRGGMEPYEGMDEWSPWDRPPYDGAYPGRPYGGPSYGAPWSGPDWGWGW